MYYFLLSISKDSVKYTFLPCALTLAFGCVQGGGVCLDSVTWSSLRQFIIVSVAIIILVKQSYH